MMWLTAPNRIGIAAWQCEHSLWNVRAASGHHALQISLAGDPDDCAGSLLIASSDGKPLPTLDEQYVRGDELHLSFPQDAVHPDPNQSFDFGFRVVLRPVAVSCLQPSPETVVFEALVSIQTTLLDLHPTLDLIASSDADVRPQSAHGIANAIHSGTIGDSSWSVILGPHDAPFTTDVDDSENARFRLFGEFLEKGVIRRARPWLVLHRGSQPLPTETLSAILSELAESPLPLR